MGIDKENNNVTYLEKSKYIIENRDILIKKRRRKRLFIKLFFLSSLLILIFITLLFKLPYFSIKDIVIINNSNVTKGEIIKLSKIQKGSNIFNINISTIKADILTNPYILKTEVKRKLPNRILIDVTERKAAFYVMKDSNYYVVDKNSVVLEKKDNISKMKLIKLIGHDGNDLVVGQVLPFKDNRKVDVIKKVTELISEDTSKINMSILDVTKAYDIRAYYANMCVRIGDSKDLKDKFSKALSIIKNQNLQNKKGYIDVSFKGNPVFRIEN